MALTAVISKDHFRWIAFYKRLCEFAEADEKQAIATHGSAGIPKAEKILTEVVAIWKQAGVNVNKFQRKLADINSKLPAKHNRPSTPQGKLTTQVLTPRTKQSREQRKKLRDQREQLIKTFVESCKQDKLLARITGHLGMAAFPLSKLLKKEAFIPQDSKAPEHKKDIEQEEAACRAKCERLHALAEKVTDELPDLIQQLSAYLNHGDPIYPTFTIAQKRQIEQNYAREKQNEAQQKTLHELFGVDRIYGERLRVQLQGKSVSELSYGEFIAALINTKIPTAMDDPSASAKIKSRWATIEAAFQKIVALVGRVGIFSISSIELSMIKDRDDEKISHEILEKDIYAGKIVAMTNYAAAILRLVFIHNNEAIEAAIDDFWCDVKGFWTEFKIFGETENEHESLWTEFEGILLGGIDLVNASGDPSDNLVEIEMPSFLNSSQETKDDEKNIESEKVVKYEKNIIESYAQKILALMIYVNDVVADNNSEKKATVVFSGPDSLEPLLPNSVSGKKNQSIKAFSEALHKRLNEILLKFSQKLPYVESIIYQPTYASKHQIKKIIDASLLVCPMTQLSKDIYGDNDVGRVKREKQTRLAKNKIFNVKPSLACVRPKDRAVSADETYHFSGVFDENIDIKQNNLDVFITSNDDGSLTPLMANDQNELSNLLGNFSFKLYLDQWLSTVHRNDSYVLEEHQRRSFNEELISQLRTGASKKEAWAHTGLYLDAVAELGLSDSEIVTLFAHCSADNFPEALNLSGNEIREAGFKFLSELLKSHLVSLDLSNNTRRSLIVEGSDVQGTHSFASSDFYVLLKDFLLNNSRLTTLNLAGNKLPNTAMLYIRVGLGCNRTLTDLDVSRNDFKAQAAAAIAAMFKENKTLQKINLARNNLTEMPDNFKKITNNLSKNTCLIELDLSFNKIDFSCVRALTTCLVENKSLQILHLDGNTFGSAGIALFAEKIFDLSLTTLTMGKCNKDNGLDLNADFQNLMTLKAEFNAKLEEVFQLNKVYQTDAKRLKRYGLNSPKAQQLLQSLRSVPPPHSSSDLTHLDGQESDDEKSGEHLSYATPEIKTLYQEHSSLRKCIDAIEDKITSICQTHQDDVEERKAANKKQPLQRSMTFSWRRSSTSVHSHSAAPGYRTMPKNATISGIQNLGSQGRNDLSGPSFQTQVFSQSQSTSAAPKHRRSKSVFRSFFS